MYRNFKVLVLHSADMMSPAKQVLIAMAPIWATALSLLWPSVATMNFELNRCVCLRVHVYVHVYSILFLVFGIVIGVCSCFLYIRT